MTLKVTSAPRDYRLLALVALVVLMASVFTLRSEANIFLSRPADDKAFSDAARAGALDIPISSYAKSALLRDCLSSMKSLYAKLQPQEYRQAHFNACRTAALKIAAENPSQSSAWFVAAFASAALADESAYHSQFEQAFDTAMHEDWQAKRRILLALDYPDFVTQDMQGMVDSDVFTILNNNSGGAWLAQLYRTRSNMKQTIADQAEKSADKYKKLFLDALKRQAS